MLWQLWVRPDRRLLVAALGIACALLLPIAGTLVLQGLSATVSEPGYLHYRTDGHEIANHGFDRAVRIEGPLAAYVAGDPVVAVGEAIANGGVIPDGLTALEGSPTPLVPTGIVVVHPSLLEGALPHVGLAAAPQDCHCLVVLARGADAFEVAGVEGLQGQTMMLIVASVPAIAMVVVAFGGLEANRLARAAATLAAMGRPNLGRQILALRFAWLLAWGAAIATVLGYLLWRFGGDAFHPADAQPIGIALAIIVPTAIGGIIGVLYAVTKIAAGDELLRTPPGAAGPPGFRIPWLPVAARPLLLGTRLFPVLFLAGLLFAVDVGFPIATAAIPAAIAGSNDEFIVGADTGLIVAGDAIAAPADVMAMHPDVDAIVAEILVPTLIDGHPVLLRGGDVAALLEYHGARGDAAAGLVVGVRLAERHGWQIGDPIAVQAAHAPLVLTVPIGAIFTGGGLLEDEALVDAATARQLTGVLPGQATLLRVQPDTLAARAALAIPEADIQVTDIRVESPGAGLEARIDIDAVNFGGTAGVRALPIRINDLAVATIDAGLAPHARGTFTTTFLAPSGSFRVDVNPSEHVAGGAPTVNITAPRITFMPDPVHVTSDADGIAWIDPDGNPVGQVDGRSATFTPTMNGTWTIRSGGVARPIIVSDDGLRDVLHFEVTATWLTPHQAPPGTSQRWYTTVVNLGGASGTDFVYMYNEDGLVHRHEVTLLSGQSRTFWIGHLAGDGTELRAGNTTLLAPIASSGDPSSVQADSGATLQRAVADRVLGDAQRAIVGLAVAALFVTVSVVYLVTERTIQGRDHVLRVFSALGQSQDRIRQRAAWEAGALAAIAFIGAALVGKIVFILLGAIGWPLPFGHSIPDPVSLLFVTQGGVAFASAGALSAYLAAGRRGRFAGQSTGSGHESADPDIGCLLATVPPRGTSDP